MCCWNDAIASTSVEVFGLIEVWFKIIHINGILALIFWSPAFFGDRQQTAPDHRQICTCSLEQLSVRLNSLKTRSSRLSKCIKEGAITAHSNHNTQKQAVAAKWNRQWQVLWQKIILFSFSSVYFHSDQRTNNLDSSDHAVCHAWRVWSCHAWPPRA